MLIELMSAEFSSMASTWSETLCMEVFEDKVVLSSRGYEPLAEAADYGVEDDSGEWHFDLPKQINGKEVRGIEDEWIIGGAFLLHDDDAEIEARRGETNVLLEWLTDRGWNLKKGFETVWPKVMAAATPPLF